MNIRRITSIEIEVNCPNCKSSFDITREELRGGETFSCPVCQHQFDSKILIKAVEDVDAAVKNSISVKIWRIIGILGLTACVIGMLTLLYLQLTQGICIKISH